MANRYILPVFKVVMEEPFIFSEPCRIGMQGIAYLLKVLGVPIGGVFVSVEFGRAIFEQAARRYAFRGIGRQV